MERGGELAIKLVVLARAPTQASQQQAGRDSPIHIYKEQVQSGREWECKVGE